MRFKGQRLFAITGAILVLLGQPASARGGGFAARYGSTHGYGGFGVHGFSAGFSGKTVGNLSTGKSQTTDSQTTPYAVPIHGKAMSAPCTEPGSI